MDDLISRQKAIDAAKMLLDYYGTNNITKEYADHTAELFMSRVPSAEPEIIHCKDCKHWKDSDGVYRRGFDAESKCPLNLKEVYEGTFYCGMAERRR